LHTTLNIIGCGNVGKTLGRLWTQAGTLVVQDVLNRSLASGMEAVAFMQAGKAVAGYDDLRAADVTLIGTPDQLIAQIRQYEQAGVQELVLRAQSEAPEALFQLIDRLKRDVLPAFGR